ncbi:MauE/DoxX family redox-associated membrane protein [Actinospica robiniae]|uniref:MauE/DoxX family redox-associated membrane protein n=1 Tax=Actinospica robiniae TaxID=304901 RepID=UPI000553FE2E|nr:MauE/DoxX family redox-associated membrane protein [Actinospica robiniae]
MTYTTLGLSISISGVFLLSAAGKLRGRAAFEEFAVSVGVLGGLPARWVRSAALALAAAEPAVALLVLVPATAPVGLGAAAILLAAFTIALVRALRRRIRTPCHCFGADAAPVGRRHVGRNAVLLGAVALDLALLPGRSGARLEPAGIALCLLAAAAAVAGVALLDDIAALFAPAPEHLR